MGHLISIGVVHDVSVLPVGFPPSRGWLFCVEGRQGLSH